MESSDFITEVAEESIPENMSPQENDESPAIDDATAHTDEGLDYDAADALQELYSSYPEICPENAESLCNLARYHELRLLGLNVNEAYLATAKRRTIADSRSHLSVSISGGSAAVSHGISESEMRSAREIFHGISDAEIRRLYKRVNN